MLKKLITVFAFAVVLSVASCRVVRDAPNKPDTTLTDIYNDVASNVKLFQDNVLEVLGVRNTDELQKKAADTGKDIAAKLDTWAADIKKDTAEWQNHPAVKNLQDTAQKTIDDFRAQHPQTAEEIKTFYEKASQGTEEIVQKIKALSESEDANNLKDLSKKLLEAASNTVQNITKEVQDNLKTKQ